MELILCKCVDKPMQIGFILVTSSSLLFFLYILDIIRGSCQRFFMLHLNVCVLFILLLADYWYTITVYRGVIVDGLASGINIWCFISSKS